MLNECVRKSRNGSESLILCVPFESNVHRIEVLVPSTISLYKNTESIRVVSLSRSNGKALDFLLKKL